MAINNYITNVYSKQKGYNIIFTHVPTDTVVTFKAFLTAFSDQYTSNWNAETVYGRIDPMQTFGGNSRTITFSFDIVSNDISEASSNLKSVRLLTRMLYPTYEKTKFATTISKAPLFRIKLANLIGKGKDGKGGGLLGAVSGFTIEPTIETGFFDPAANVLYPKEYTASITFNVLHEENPGDWTSEVDTKEQGPPFEDQDPLQGPILGGDTYRGIGVDYDPTADDALLQNNDRAAFTGDAEASATSAAAEGSSADQPPSSSGEDVASTPSTEKGATEDEVLR
jgi:hypothetical protein